MADVILSLISQTLRLVVQFRAVLILLAVLFVFCMAKKMLWKE
jgi:hypothetical protein